LRVIYFINSLIRLTIVETRTYDSAIVVPQNFCQQRISRGRIHVHMRACIAGVLATDAHASTFRQFIYTNGQKTAAEINIGLYYSQNKIREELNSWENNGTMHVSRVSRIRGRSCEWCSGFSLASGYRRRLKIKQLGRTIVFL